MSKNNKIFGVLLILSVVVLTLVLLFREEIVYYVRNIFKNENYQMEYVEEIKSASEEFSVPEALVYAIIKTESDFKADAVSSAGAIGLMQLMPDTFSWVSTRLGETVSDDMIKDPKTNIRYGTYYLSFLMERLENDEAIYASYNAGYTRVCGWLSDSRYSSDGKKLDTIPYDETAEYVKRVIRAKKEYESILSKEANKSISSSISNSK